MQILTRQVNEGFIINDRIHVTVLEIHDDHVRLAFEVPDEEPPYWEEILYLENVPGAGQLQLH